MAVLVFGGMFGFWGVFFAIPLATLVQAILKAWFSRTDGVEEEETDEKITEARAQVSET